MLNMKKIFYTIIAALSIFGTTACSDMLEVDSSRQVFDPAIDQKTDSVFYAYGIMQAMQQLADQYYYQNEMRGDLVSPTVKASTHLRNLASFTADATNKYDSVYLYYKVINNCNYYLAHRDTTLATGKENVVCNEYAAVASFRAWAYLQLARQYGAVPYVTEPVTTIEQINANTAMTGYEAILRGEAMMLEELKARYNEDQIAVPTFGYTSNSAVSAGKLNWGSREDKNILPENCFVPLNVVLGDIYLELGEYAKAATCYYQYLRYKGMNNISKISTAYAVPLSIDYSRYSPIFKNFTEWPVDYKASSNSLRVIDTWEASFDHAANPGDVISYIPMAVNYTMGKTTDIPASYGYNYYGAGNSNTVVTGAESRFDFNCPKTEDIQIVPSPAYCDSARKAQYYYGTGVVPTGSIYEVIKNEPLGDARAYIISQGSGADSSYVYTYKPSTAYILLYRCATVWLHFAEAVNRMGHPDLAFAVLKNGIHPGLSEMRYREVYLKDTQGNDSIDASGNKVLDMTQSHIGAQYYITPESYELLTTTLPFLSQENSMIFNSEDLFIGMHARGAGVPSAIKTLESTYRYNTVVEAKIADLNKKFNLGLQNYTKEDYINAMEDLLCDEYAMEFAFEGTRFSDLRRLAIHKNRSGIYGGNFGDTWLSRKLENNAVGITTQNCYLPYK